MRAPMKIGAFFIMKNYIQNIPLFDCAGQLYTTDLFVVNDTDFNLKDRNNLC